MLLRLQTEVNANGGVHVQTMTFSHGRTLLLILAELQNIRGTQQSLYRLFLTICFHPNEGLGWPLILQQRRCRASPLFTDLLLWPFLTFINY